MLWNLLNDAAGTPQDSNTQLTFWQQLMANKSMLIITIIILVALVGMFVWSTISNKKKRKEAEQMVTGLAIGDKVKTIGGVCGYVVEVNDAENTFVLETGTDAKKSYVKFDKGAIYKTAPANNSAPAKAEAPAVEEKPAPAKKAKKAVKVEEPVVEEVKEEK